jgi:hypothetical protein
MTGRDTMKVAHYTTPPHEYETCQWCGAQIRQVTLITDEGEQEYILGPECGTKARAAIYEAEMRRKEQKARELRDAQIQQIYKERFGE